MHSPCWQVRDAGHMWWKGIPGSSASTTPEELETQGDADRVASCLVHLLKSVNPGSKGGRGPAVHLAETLC